MCILLYCTFTVVCIVLVCTIFASCFHFFQLSENTKFPNVVQHFLNLLDFDFFFLLYMYVNKYEVACAFLLLQSSLAQSEEQIAVTREKNVVAMKQFEEERLRMKGDILHLEERLKKQQQESQVSSFRLRCRICGTFDGNS